MSEKTLGPEHYKARVIRAFSGLSQDQMARRIGVAPSLISQMEKGDVLPAEDHLEKMAEQARFAPGDADEMLALYDLQTRTWQRTGVDAGAILDALVRRLQRHSRHAVQRLLKLQRPRPADPDLAEKQLASLRRLSYRSRLAVVRLAEEYRNPALAQRCRDEARRHPGRAAAWNRVAEEIEART